MLPGIYAADEIPVDDFINELTVVQRKKGQRKKKHEREILDIVTAFDIETTKVAIPDLDGVEHYYSFMYIWQFQLGPKYTIMGRTWDDFTKLQSILKQISAGIKDRLKLSSYPRFACYVHNLAYEWQYLQGIYAFTADDVFFRDVRKPIYCELNHILELRCSYLHSNMSLGKFGEFVGTTAVKLDGDLYDYDKIRMPWTELSDEELLYCVNDVRTLEEAIRLEMQRDGDTLKTIPYTSTGYIRREIKNALKPLHYTIMQLLPDLFTYSLLSRCFRGGDVHANRFRVGKIWESGDSYDRESSYPDIILNYLFPMGPFKRLKDEDCTLERVIKLIKCGNAVIADYHFKGLRLKDHKNGFPYLPESKCEIVGDLVRDNGRIISADLCIVALTEIDLEIILDEYEFTTISVYNACTAIKGMLPKAIRDVVQKYYERKTALKGKDGSEYFYAKSKNVLNASYGNFAQRPVHPIIEYLIDGVKTTDGNITQYLKHMPVDEQADDELKKANFPYQWGVYTTAYARFELRRAIKLAGKDSKGYSNVLYVDTDSIKTIKPVNLEKLNKEIHARSEKNGATAYDSSGSKHYIGSWDHEYSYVKFIALRAKCYAYIKLDKKGNEKMGVTISGVTHKEHKYYKEDGVTVDHKVEYAVEELEKLENLKDGLTFTKAGGTASVYMDKEDCIDKDGNWIKYTDPVTGRSVDITPCVSIVDTTYTLKLDEDDKEKVDTFLKFQKFLIETGRGKRQYG